MKQVTVIKQDTVIQHGAVMKPGTVFAAVAAVTFLAVAAPVAAQDVSGMWEVSWESPRGAQTFVITFEQDGMELTGTAQMRRGEGTVSDGMIHGNEVSFTLSMGGGRFTLTFKGEVDGDTMAGTLTTPRGASPWTGKKKEEG